MISIKVRGLAELQKFLASVPHGTKQVAIPAFTDYLIGNENHGLRHYPKYKSVTRKAAYGQTFQSDKQRKWFFANLNDGNLDLPYQRTFNLRRGWVKTSGIYNTRITNRVPYAHHVMSDDRQSRMSQKIGWRTISKVITDNMVGAMRAANQAVARWLKSKQG